MSRGERSGGGQSSLNYLFGSEEKPKPSPPKKVSCSLPPYGIEMDNNNPPIAHPPPSQGQHLGNLLTVSLSILFNYMAEIIMMLLYDSSSSFFFVYLCFSTCICKLLIIRIVHPQKSNRFPVDTRR